MTDKIFISEYVSGGGFNKDNMPISLFSEGFGMLRSVIMDFKSLGMEICTTLDYRISHLSNLLQVNKLIVINDRDGFLKIFNEMVKVCKYVFIIAPESANILYNLSNIVIKHNRILLSINLEGIKIGTSKLATYKLFRINKTNTPRTYLIPLKRKELSVEFIIDKFKKLTKPIIIKPNDGVGSESIYYFDSKNQIKNFFQEFKNKLIPNRKYVVQEFIEGMDLSASLINVSHALKPQIKNPFVMSINFQDVNIKTPYKDSEYFGGYTPIENHFETNRKLNKILQTIDFSDFYGYFGIDFILTNDSQIYFIEINPRLTTSYIGLRNTISQNPANLIMDSKIKYLKPANVKFVNYSLFTRIELEYTNSQPIENLNEEITDKLISKIPEFVTPPISFGKSHYFTCFIATKTKDLPTSRRRLDEIKQALQNFGFKLVK
ncbi:MAG: ATP-grasp domain-containing protein [Promethearchaeota archaeon]|jgi:predicted ATP-grasp superfamily ATP-dependent carboligase